MSDKPRFLYLVGSVSGAGKSTVALGLLHALRQRFESAQLAYIKPATQCESVTLVSKYCVAEGIATVATSPIVFYAGYTQECLDNKKGTAEDRLQIIVDAIHSLSIGKKYVIIDGVGYPSVGHVCGISNGHIAAALHAPVLLIGRAGVGDAIDSTEYMRGYLSHHRAEIFGAAFNNIPKFYGYHKYEDCCKYVTKYFSTANPPLQIYGYIPALASPTGEKAINTSASMSTPADDNSEEGQSCAVRSFLRRKKGEPLPEKEFGPEYEMSAEDEKKMQSFCELFNEYVKIDQLLQDWEAFHSLRSTTENADL